MKEEYPHCILTVFPLYPHCIPTVSSLYPYVINLSSHLQMVHNLNGVERTHHLKNAVLCPTT